jgi:hypothetical protein
VRVGPEEGQENKMALYPGRVLEHEGQPDEEEGGQGDVQLDYGHNGPEQEEKPLRNMVRNNLEAV